MKVKTSITLSDDLLKTLDHLGESRSRSEVIDQALRAFLQRRLERLREEKDLHIMNERSNELNEEAEDVLSYQVPL